MAHTGQEGSSSQPCSCPMRGNRLQSQVAQQTNVPLHAAVARRRLVTRGWYPHAGMMPTQAMAALGGAENA
jgi:hypothetical protein